MVDIIAGVLGIAAAALFLGFLAFDIGSIPLTIIVVVVIGMMTADLVGTVRGSLRQRDDRGPS
ncbi:MAG: hypothetical protein QGG17_06720 [Rhodospirillales bacterium]|jgi:hypothetical protein|nr:hypothetical protein [Rhodospirillales bacterium]MDP6805958.1 hypothetical protein [Rhodospirillales bacterium]